VLLTVLGVNSRSARYVLEDREVEARLAPVALLDLMPEKCRPGRVLALCPPEAKRESLPLLVEALRGRLPIEAVSIPGGETQEDVSRFLATVVGEIDPGVELTVDVTHGFRHFSFLTYIALLYLASLHGVRVRAAYYGMLTPEGPSPFLDLRPLLDLPRWIYALEVLRDTGSALPIARNLLEGPRGQPARDNARDLLRLSEAYLSGLPLELGWQARNVLTNREKPLRRLLGERGHRLPLADELVGRLSDLLEPLALDESFSGDGWKGHLRLTESELGRQAKIIDDLLERESYATALGLMREWLVSWVVFQQTGEGNWLRRDVRQKAEGFLHAVRSIAGDPELRGTLTDEQRALGRFWNDLAEVRNAYAHHGMRGDDLARDGKLAAARTRVLTRWKESIRSGLACSMSIGEAPGGRVLISPIGKRPGVLFSAVHAARRSGAGGDPTLCLVICSRDTEGLIADAVEQAQFAGVYQPLVLADAFSGGCGEIKQLAMAARKHFIGAIEVMVNATGGTTLMGLAAEELASVARSLACPVRRFGLIDRRSAREQDMEPYQPGEPFWLDADEDSDADRD